MSDVISDIKGRLQIQDVVGAYVQLKKAGVNYKGLCPFHGEKTPSFVVSPEKQIFHCFGCNKGGDIFTFIQEVDGVEFPEAVQILADKAGVKVKNVDKLYKKGEKNAKEEYYLAHEVACKLFEKNLHKSKEGEKVLEYLHSRGISDKTIEEFRLGFAPDEYEFLHPQLLKEGISKDVLLRSGLVSSKGVSDDRIFDKFRCRLMFPIFDYMGKIAGFGGRALQAEQMPKYLNSADNLIYNKSKILYGFSHAKSFVKEKESLILVEGYFDFLLPFQEGVKNIAAVSGTALTKEHIHLIKRFTSNVISSFDTDGAGFEATKRAYSLFEEEGLTMKVIAEFAEKDPADLVKAQGGEAFSELATKSLDFIFFFLDKLLLTNDPATIDGRKNLLNTMIPYLKRMSPGIMDFYVRELSKKITINEKVLYDEVERYKVFKNTKDFEREAFGLDMVSTRSRVPVEDVILGLLLTHPGTFAGVVELIDEEMFTEEAKNIYKELEHQYNSARDKVEEWNFDNDFLASLKAKIDVLSLYAEDHYLSFTEEAVAEELVKLIDKMKQMALDQKKRELQLKIEEAEKRGNKEELMVLMKAAAEIASETK